MEGDRKTGAGIQQIDETYEFCAPRFFDFTNEESEEQIKSAELWFETSDSYAPSPFMPKIREGRSVQINSLCNFENVEKIQMESLQTDNNKIDDSTTTVEKPRSLKDLIAIYEVKPDEEKIMNEMKSFQSAPENKSSPAHTLLQEEKSSLIDVDTSIKGSLNVAAEKAVTESQTCTPKPEKFLPEVDTVHNISKRQTAKKIASVIREASSGKAKGKPPPIMSKLKSVTRQASSGRAKSKPPSIITKPNGVIKCPLSIDIAHENQAIKKQKLDCGKSRKIHNVKSRMLSHKSKTEHYISTAEIVKKFESTTRDIEFTQKKSASHESTASIIQKRPKLKLTRPKEPEFVTSQRTRVIRVKSSAELEEEMLAKIPKFKARPVNKKILEAPTLPSVPRSAPQPIEFKEFHLRTMDRANQHMESSSVASSVDESSQADSKQVRLTELGPPRLQTALRTRPVKLKSSQELELEELEKVPKFKARPLNKKIFENKENHGLVQNSKPQITVTHEFHFATDDRLGPSLAVVDMFDKLSLHSESSSQHEKNGNSRITNPNPFHLHTEERGVEKVKQLENQVLKKQIEEESARVPKAKPYPYSTDFPVMPPKPEPKKCTKPEAFQLESLIRHELELHKKMDEKEKIGKEEEQKRLFKAQPMMKYDQIPVKKIERKPLTDVQEFKLHVNQRAVERSEFDKKMKEKETIYKRMRDESESAKLIEEEKEVKQMRRELVLHARPLPKFDNPFHPQKSMKIPTKPRSPILHVNQRGETRKRAHLR